MERTDTIVAHPRSMVFPIDTLPISAGEYCITGSVAPHRHMFIEIAVILNGQGCHYAEGGTCAVHPGDIFVIHPGDWHAYDQCRQCEIANCYVGTELLNQELAWLRDEPTMALILQAAAAKLHEPRHAIGSLAPEQIHQYRAFLNQLKPRSDQPDRRLHIEQIGLLIAALGVLAHATVDHSGPSRSPVSQVHPVVNAAQRLFEQYLAYDWTLTELAYQLHIDRSYLVRLFRQHTGLAPMQFLAQQRAERAAFLVRTTRQSIAEIGRSVGWADANLFSRRFRAFFGVSASEYRTRMG